MVLMVPPRDRRNGSAAHHQWMPPRRRGTGPLVPTSSVVGGSGPGLRESLAQQRDEGVVLEGVAGRDLLVAAVEGPGSQALLGVDELGDLRVDGAGGEDAPRGDRLVLADAVHTVDGLLLLGRGPRQLGE